MFEIILHGIQIFLAFITLCCAGSLAHFQQKWHIGISGLSTFLIITSLILLFLPLTMLLPPVLNKRYDTLERMTALLKEPRVQWVLAGTGAGVAAIDAISISASVFSQPGCKDPTRDPHASIGAPYRDALGGWCTTKKATAVFLWLLFLAWLVLLGKIGWDTYTRRSSTRHRPYRTKEYAPSARSPSGTEEDGTRFPDSGTSGIGMPLMHSAEMGPFDTRYIPAESQRRSGWRSVPFSREEAELDVTDDRFTSPPRGIAISPPNSHAPTMIPLGPPCAIPLGPPIPLSPPQPMMSQRLRLPSHSFSRTPVSPPPSPAPIGISRTMILAASGDTDDPYARSRQAMGYGKEM